jgi:Recombination endonuclease VII
VKPRTEAQKKAHAAKNLAWWREHREICAERAHKWYIENIEVISAKGRLYRKANAEAVKARKAKWMADHPGYGMQLYIANQEKLVGRKKPKRCDVCKKPGRICFDHCHTSAMFRGWLCLTCNLALGHVKDDQCLCQSLAEYLERPLPHRIITRGGRLRKADQAIVGKRPYKCEVCKSTGRVYMDHCHKRNLFRGWLCHTCNAALGYVNDSPRLLRKLATYLMASRTKKGRK